MINLDNYEQIKRLDKANMSDSLANISRQFQLVFQNKIKLPKKYYNFQNVCLLGMGGSALGAHFIKSVWSTELKKNLIIVNDYNLPAYIKPNLSLLILSSYSGQTEEVVYAFKQAKKKGFKIIILTAGGKLEQLAKQNSLPFIKFSTAINYCQAPRIGLGYSIAGLLKIFNALHLLNFGLNKQQDLVNKVKFFIEKYNLEQKINKNLSKKIAKQLVGWQVYFIGSEHLSANAHISANQINENAKQFSSYFILPEMDHHLIEGLSEPTNKKICFFGYNSKLYFNRIQKRYSLTAKIFKKNNIKYFEFSSTEKTKLDQALEVLIFSSYVSFYLGLLNGYDPTIINNVNFLKKHL